jgi:hypothetical protein
VLRGASGLKKKDGEEFSMFFLPNIIRNIKSRMRWAEYVQ